MTCAELEILLADYVDGTLRGAEKAAVEEHLAVCAACKEFASDASGAVEFMDRAAVADPPPELVTKLLYEISSGPSREYVKPSWVRRWFGRRLEPILQPRFAMGMAMTVLSFAMLGRFSGIEVRQLKPSDLDPVKVWMATEDRANRVWERAMKYYDGLKLVYEIRAQLREWSEDANEAAQPGNPAPASPAPASPTQSPAPVASPSAGTPDGPAGTK